MIKFANENYFINVPTNNNKIEVWSSKRLSFEPKGWELDMRNKLRLALKSMKCDKDKIFYGGLHSIKNEFFDVENVLLYNIGSGSYSHLCDKGICIERIYEKPPQMGGNGAYDSMDYHHSYSMIKNTNKSYWKKRKTIASWNDVSFYVLNSGTKPHDIWYKMKNSEVSIFENEEKTEKTLYGISLNIHVPMNYKSKISSFIKQLLDGIISSFHVHDGTDLEKVSILMGEKLKESTNNIRRMLLDKSTAVLGSNKLVKPYSSSFQWNPDDHKFAFIEVYINRPECAEKINVTGDIFTIQKNEEWRR